MAVFPCGWQKEEHLLLGKKSLLLGGRLFLLMTFKCNDRCTGEANRVRGGPRHHDRQSADTRANR